MVGGELGCARCSLQLGLLRFPVLAPNLIVLNDRLLIRALLNALTRAHREVLGFFAFPSSPFISCASFLLETPQFLVSFAGCCVTFRRSPLRSCRAQLSRQLLAQWGFL